MINGLEAILDFYKSFPQVKAIAIGGSSSAGTNDMSSDIDLYVFTQEDIPVEEREKFTSKISSKYEVGAEYFGAGDEYFADNLSNQLDVMYWNTKWFEGVVDNVWFKHYPSNGYTTCFLYTLSIFNIVYDPQDWLKNLRESISTPYPEELRQNIIQRNLMLMKDKPFASYYEQIKKAVERNDIVSVNHRIAAFMASYFDVIFAMNNLLHPGEKRLTKYAKEHCEILPVDFESDIENLLKQPNGETLNILEKMAANLKALLKIS